MSYYYTPSPAPGHHRSRSQQYYYPSQPAYYSSPAGTSSSHRRYNSIGPSYPQQQQSYSYGGSHHGHGTPVVQYASSGQSHRRHRSSSRPRATVDSRGHRYPSSHTPHRSQSVPRYSSSRPSYPHDCSQYHMSFGERLRRMFGLGPSKEYQRHQHKYGREVDRQGRQIYRV